MKDEGIQMFISLVDANYDGGLGKANIRYVYGEREGLDDVVEVMKRMEPLEWKDAICRRGALISTCIRIYSSVTVFSRS